MRPFAYEKIPEFYIKIIPAITVTLEYVILSFVLGLIFGFFLAQAKISRLKGLRTIAYGYTTIMRCTPSVVLLFLVYYGLPMLCQTFFGINIDAQSKTKFVVITLTLFCTSSLSEVIRSSYEAVDKSQIEAAASVGLTNAQAIWYIMLPQMLYTAIPNFCNTILNLLKEGALAYTIGLIDLLGKANYVIGKNLGAYVIETYITLVFIYWPLSILITKCAKYLEAHLDYDNKRKKERRVIRDA